MTILTAGSNLFVSMPPQLARVAALRDLSIDNNVITTLPPLQPFFRLQHLSLCHNTLKTLPRSIGIFATHSINVRSSRDSHLREGDLVALETLNLAYNQLSALPDEMNNLRQLKYLGLEGNRNLQSISLELSRMAGTQIKVPALGQTPYTRCQLTLLADGWPVAHSRRAYERAAHSRVCGESQSTRPAN